MARRGNFHTIYHVMDEKGIFAQNPANSDAVDMVEGTSLYTGPVDFPKMFYHPEGKTRIINPGETIVDPLRGPMIVGQQSEIIWELARNGDDEARFRSEGWHDHPSKAIAAGGGEAPPTSSAQRIDDLESQIERLQRELSNSRQPPGKTKHQSQPEA